MVKFILTVPNHLKADVLQQMLVWRGEAPDEVQISITDKPERQRREPPRAPVAAEVTVEQVPEQTSTAPAPIPVTPVDQPDNERQAERYMAGLPTAPVDRSTKVYRVIDTASYVGPVPHMIRMYLIDHPNSTAKQIEAATGRGTKSVESAIWMLRDKGIVKESLK